MWKTNYLVNFVLDRYQANFHVRLNDTTQHAPLFLYKLPPMLTATNQTNSVKILICGAKNVGYPHSRGTRWTNSYPSNPLHHQILPDQVPRTANTRLVAKILVFLSLMPTWDNRNWKCWKLWGCIKLRTMLSVMITSFPNLTTRKMTTHLVLAVSIPHTPVQINQSSLLQMVTHPWNVYNRCITMSNPQNTTQSVTTRTGFCMKIVYNVVLK